MCFLSKKQSKEKPRTLAACGTLLISQESVRVARIFYYLNIVLLRGHNINSYGTSPPPSLGKWHYLGYWNGLDFLVSHSSQVEVRNFSALSRNEPVAFNGKGGNQFSLEAR